LREKGVRVLREKGVKPDSIVGLMVERSIEMIICIMGVLKAGGAYLPIDIDYPEDRVTSMLDDSGIKILISNEKIDNISGTCLAGNKKISNEREIILLNNIEAQLKEKSDENLLSISRSSSLLYTIYTSGTTGKPKGVNLEHKNAINLIYFEYNKTCIDFSTNVMQFANMSFDVCYQEIFSTLLAGGRLSIINQENKKVLARLFDFIKVNNINIMFLPTAFLKFIATQGEYENVIPVSIKHIIVAGEQLIITEEFREFISRRGIYLHNHYGPSETHVVTALTMTGKNIPLIPPIGAPISNTKIYILSKEKLIQPIGVWGELYISGDSVGRGYLNRPELTQEKFLVNPVEKEKKVYRTGDIARWLADGNIEFLGRIDHQVKIRGYRIELGEIEVQLRKHEQIKEVVVLVKEDQTSNKYLCSYIVAEVELSIQELREHLSKELPDYMIPSSYVQLEKMLLTPNGKIDRSAMLELDGSICKSVEYAPPTNKAEQQLAEIWQEVLGVERVGMNDNFFELGGHSLKATLLVSKIHKEFNVEIPLREVFKKPVIKDFAQYIKSSERNIYESVVSVDENDYYALSSAQKRLYILSQLEGAGTSYNMPAVVEVEGNLDKDRLERSLEEIIRRHESLRTSFQTVDGEPVQKIYKKVKFKIQYIQSDKNNKNEKIKDFIRPFDLSKPPLLRLGLIKIAKNKHLMLFDMHHLISDGTSMNVLIKEFTQHYEGKDLEQLKIQYKDYSTWQNELLKSDSMKKQEEHWLNTLSGEIPVLNMPIDFQRPSIQSFEGNRLAFEAGQELTNKLETIVKETQTTMYMVLLAAYNTLLYKYTGQEDIIVGSPIAGRPHADLQDIIGMFVNTLAMRNKPKGNMNFKELLKEVKENALKAYENQDYQFEELIDKLGLKRDMSRNALFDTMFVLQNTGNMEIKIDGLRFKPYHTENRISKFDMTLNATQQKGRIYFDLEYCTKLFSKDTIQRLARHYMNILEGIASNITINLSEINILSEQEEQQILHEFNTNIA